MIDRRLNKEWRIVDNSLPPQTLFEKAILSRKIGPGHFVAKVDGKEVEVYSCQLRRIESK